MLSTRFEWKFSDSFTSIANWPYLTSRIFDDLLSINLTFLDFASISLAENDQRSIKKTIINKKLLQNITSVAFFEKYSLPES